MFNFSSKLSSEKGFSILEVIVAVAVAAIAFVGMMALFAYNIRTEINSRNKLIATYLAQEAMEAARYQRNLNWHDGKITSPDCWNGLASGDNILRLTTPGTVNSATSWRFVPAAGLDNRVYVNKTSGTHDQTGGTMGGLMQFTTFTRTVNFQPAGDRLKIQVTVGYGGEKKLILHSYLYNWKQ